MSEVTDASLRTSTAPRPLQGSNVWYELMTTDPDAAKAFYGSVVGWTIGDPVPSGGQDYRMIERNDGHPINHEDFSDQFRGDRPAAVKPTTPGAAILPPGSDSGGYGPMEGTTPPESAAGGEAIRR